MMMTEDVLEAKKSIEYLTLQASKTSVADLRMLFYSMIQGHVKTTTLAAVREEYVLKTLDPALVPLGPSGPDRDRITIWGLLGGLVFSLSLVLLSHFLGYELRGLKKTNN